MKTLSICDTNRSCIHVEVFKVMCKLRSYSYVPIMYRVIQEEISVFWKVMVSIIVRKSSYEHVSNSGAGGGVVIKALHYKPAGRGFDSQWCHWNFFQ